MKRLTASVVISTFDSPATLRLVLLGLARQSALPLEALVADDGSGDATAAVLERTAPELPFPLLHVWQPHRDFRAARSRNNAVSRARGDTVAFLDQDTVPHAFWLETLADRLAGNEVALGDAIALSEREAAELGEEAVRSGGFERFFSEDNRRRLAGLQRRGAFYAWLRRAGLGIKAKPRLRSCNFAVAAARLRDVNGFDEAYVGWGQEDDDLGRRLYRRGVRPVIRIWGARVSHWPHPPRRPADWNSGANARRYREGDAGPARCEAGLSRHPHPDVRARFFAV